MGLTVRARMRNPRNWKIAMVAFLIVAAFALASYSAWSGGRKSHDARLALCKVLLYVRAAGLMTATSDAQIDRVTSFYDDLIDLVDGCHAPPGVLP